MFRVSACAMHEDKRVEVEMKKYIHSTTTKTGGGSEWQQQRVNKCSSNGTDCHEEGTGHYDKVTTPTKETSSSQELEAPVEVRYFTWKSTVRGDVVVTGDGVHTDASFNGEFEDKGFDWSFRFTMYGDDELGLGLGANYIRYVGDNEEGRGLGLTVTLIPLSESKRD